METLFPLLGITRSISPPPRVDLLDFLVGPGKEGPARQDISDEAGADKVNTSSFYTSGAEDGVEDDAWAGKRNNNEGSKDGL